MFLPVFLAYNTINPQHMSDPTVELCLSVSYFTRKCRCIYVPVKKTHSPGSRLFLMHVILSVHICLWL